MSDKLIDQLHLMRACIDAFGKITDQDVREVCVERLLRMKISWVAQDKT